MELVAESGPARLVRDRRGQPDPRPRERHGRAGGRARGERVRGADPVGPALSGLPARATRAERRVCPMAWDKLVVQLATAWRPRLPLRARGATPGESSVWQYCTNPVDIQYFVPADDRSCRAPTSTSASGRPSSSPRWSAVPSCRSRAASAGAWRLHVPARARGHRRRAGGRRSRRGTGRPGRRPRAAEPVDRAAGGDARRARGAAAARRHGARCVRGLPSALGAWGTLDLRDARPERRRRPARRGLRRTVPAGRCPRAPAARGAPRRSARSTTRRATRRSSCTRGARAARTTMRGRGGRHSRATRRRCRPRGGHGRTPGSLAIRACASSSPRLRGSPRCTADAPRRAAGRRSRSSAVLLRDLVVRAAGPRAHAPDRGGRPARARLRRARAARRDPRRTTRRCCGPTRRGFSDERRRRPGRAELREIVSGLAADPQPWSHLVRHDPAQRVFECLRLDDQVEIWLICWMPGHDTGFHDHDLSSGAVVVAQGAVVEERLRLGAPARAPPLRARRRLRLLAGRHPPRDPRGHDARRRRCMRTLRRCGAWAPTSSSRAARSSATRWPRTKSCGR